MTKKLFIHWHPCLLPGGLVVVIIMMIMIMIRTCTYRHKRRMDYSYTKKSMPPLDTVANF